MIEYIFRRFPRLREKYVHGLQRFFKYWYPHNGVKVMSEKWDYLLVLDACRYDYFRKYNDIKGKLEKRFSLASSTKEWVRKNFRGKYPDVVYVSANPFISKLMLRKLVGGNPFFYVDEVWNYGWNENLQTVLPGVVTKSVLENIEKSPDKKIIAHFLQPHYPFIGEGRLIKGWKRARHLWFHAQKGEIETEKVKKGYVGNLKIVLKEVKNLLKELVGKVVITSDHGNCFGEYWLYGHPSGVYIKSLVEIPWLIIEK